MTLDTFLSEIALNFVIYRSDSEIFLVSVWTENYNGTPAWTIPIPKESVGPFGAFAPFVSANGETVVYGPRSFDGKFPSASFKPAIFWWTNVGKNRRPDLNKLDLTVWPGTRLGFTLSGDGKRGSAVVGPYIWQIDLINYDLLAQIPFKFPWRNICSSFDGSCTNDSSLRFDFPVITLCFNLYRFGFWLEYDDHLGMGTCATQFSIADFFSLHDRR